MSMFLKNIILTWIVLTNELTFSVTIIQASSSVQYIRKERFLFSTEIDVKKKKERNGN